MKWVRKPLSEVADFSLGKMLDQKKNKGTFRPYLANVNVQWGSFDLQHLREMRFEAHEADRYGLKSGDIVMCEGGEPGRCAIWRDEIPGVMIQKALHRIRPRTGLNHRFLFYSLLHQGKSGALDRLFTGSTIKHLPREKLAMVEVVIPPPATQARIASILSAYDDLIENNTRRIAILEEMARRIYEEWFVHFRAPGCQGLPLVESSLGPIPEGWRVRTLKNLTTKIGSGATPKGGKNSYRTEGTALVRSQNVYDYQFDYDGLAFIDDEQATQLSNVSLKQSDVLLNITGASVARCCLLPTAMLPGRVNQHVAIVRADRTVVQPVFLLDSINEKVNKQRLLAISHGGATREALTKQVIENFAVVVAPPAVLAKHAALVEPMHSLRDFLARLNHNLRAQRNLLLPKLISGEIDVSEAEELMEAAE